jgi:hypothetical protein
MLNQNDIQKARHHLRAADTAVKAVIDFVGPFTLRLERDRFTMPGSFHHFPADLHRCGPLDPQAIAGACPVQRSERVSDLSNLPRGSGVE